MKQAAALYSIELDPIKNLYLKSDVAFTTGKGSRVHVGAAAAAGPDGGAFRFDKEKLFLALTTDRDEHWFVRGREIINWGFLYRGSGTVFLDGERYDLKAYADLFAPKNSKLVIKGPAGTVLEATLKQLGGAVAGKGVDVRLSRTYKLAYGNELRLVGDAARFTDRTFIAMVPFPVKASLPPFIFDVSKLTSSGVAFSAFDPRFGFRLNGGALEIYPVQKF